MNRSEWLIARGFLADDGHVHLYAPESIHPMIVDFIKTFSHRIEAWSVTDDGELDQHLSSGMLDDDGYYVTLDHEQVREGTHGFLREAHLLVDLLDMGVSR